MLAPDHLLKSSSLGIQLHTKNASKAPQRTLDTCHGKMTPKHKYKSYDRHAPSIKKMIP